MNSVLESRNEKVSKRIYISILVANYIAVLIYNFLTPPMSDDLYWHPGTHVPMSEILRDSWAYYNNWLGRIESYFFTRVADAYPKSVYNIVSSIFFIGLILALYFCIERKKKYDYRTLALISLYIWIWGIDFAQTMLWVCGACNYLWCLAIEFGFLAFYRYRISTEHTKNLGKKQEILGIVGIFLWGLLAGDGNESSSGGVFLLILYFTIKKYIDKKEARQHINKWEISGISGFLLGLIIMVAAPGNRIRGSVSISDEENRGILMYFGRFLKINDIVYQYMPILIVTVVVMLAYMHLYHKKSIIQLLDIYVYIVVAILATYVIILTTIPMPRAFMGGSMILLIAATQLLSYIDENDVALNIALGSATIVMALFMTYSYIDNSANLVRILRELSARQEYVDEQKAMGKYSLTLPMLRTEWDNRYTFIYHNNDVSEEPDSFGNSIYRVYYGLEDVIGIPYDEWEKD